MSWREFMPASAGSRLPPEPARSHCEKMTRDELTDSVGGILTQPAEQQLAFCDGLLEHIESARTEIDRATAIENFELMSDIWEAQEAEKDMKRSTQTNQTPWTVDECRTRLAKLPVDDEGKMQQHFARLRKWADQKPDEVEHRSACVVLLEQTWRDSRMGGEAAPQSAEPIDFFADF